ncbi:hypothetical protein F5887DRAFT_1061833 [Amanita rubescens]|nr:hypothetical protein F5887DRAFT_1061833 [Amanita rubescens]
MHLIWENLIPNLVLFWSRCFKELSHNEMGYALSDSVWKDICRISAEAGDTIPAAFGCRVPNMSSQRWQFKAESWATWTIYIAPIVLRGRFPQDKYYKHFLRLVHLLNLCLEYELPMEKVAEIENGFIRWVEDYERFYYQHDVSRLSACPLTIHALLHIGPSIRANGPVWANWAFPIERYCGDVVRHVKNRRYPYISINNYVTASAQLAQLKLRYNLDKELSFGSRPDQDDHAGHIYDESPRKLSRLSRDVYAKAVATLVTLGDSSLRTVKKWFPEDTEILQFGKVTRINGGDSMHGRDLVGLREHERDASFVRYYQYIDKNRRFRNKRVELEERTYYGQLRRVLVIKKPQEAKDILLAVVQSIKVDETPGGCNITFYKEMGPSYVVDLNTVECVVGRIWDRERWAIVDRAPKSHT